MENPGFEVLNTELLTILGHLNDTMSIMEELDESKRESLYQGLQEVINSFRTLKKIAGEVKGSVPLKVISLCDEGKDPRECAKSLVDDVQETRNRVKKKQEWMDHLKNSLDMLIAANFPGESYEMEK